ncbi:MAG TPA: sigma-70 family RNA polymerase sigma factor, partial [Planctomycetota bacterium]|nr:sigma-70 family RNA polymerase sigma factor [Planctomycetota bacterium]
MAAGSCGRAMESERDPGVVWMLAWQAGDEAAFDRLVEAYSGPLYALLTRFLGPVRQREDLVQEVFLRVVRARDRYRPTARFSTFLYRIAFNLAANERERSRFRRTRPLDAGGEPFAGAHGEHAEHGERG